MNRIVSVSDAVESRALTWSGDGDLYQEVRTPVGGGAPVTWTYHWTYGQRLAVVVNDAAVSPLTASYHYDSDDRRTKKVVNGVTTRTLWSEADELAEYDVNGDLIRRFIPDGTGTMDQRLATVTPAGVVYWHHTDHQGSVIATSDSAGKTVGTATYSPHGEGAPPAQSPFGYTGRQYDPETGLYYYRARYYSPYLGQFLAVDPIGTKDDPNLYMYVGLDPTNSVDPTGLDGVTLFSKYEPAGNLLLGANALNRSSSSVYFVSAHGNRQELYDQRSRTEYEYRSHSFTSPLSGSLLNSVIRNGSGRANFMQTIMLMACEIGYLDYPSVVAMGNGSNVWAPEGYVFTEGLLNGGFRFTVSSTLSENRKDGVWTLTGPDGRKVEGAAITMVVVDANGNVRFWNDGKSVDPDQSSDPVARTSGSIMGGSGFASRIK